MASYECKMDNGSFSPCSSGDTWLVFVEGSHTFAVRAIDHAGNADGIPATYTWTISTSTVYKIFLPLLIKY